jgi:hypothetical protein
MGVETMKNAHLRMGTLQFHKVTRDTTIDVRLWMDRLIAEHEDSAHGRAKAHLISVFGGDQEIAAISAAITEEGCFQVQGTGISALTVSLGVDAETFRSSISVPGRKRPVRHLVAISKELELTRAGGEPKAQRTVLCSGTPGFVLYRLAVRFGLPVLPEWSEWFHKELTRRRAIQPLIGLGCEPILVNGTKKRFLAWIGHGLKRRQIQIPDGHETQLWTIPARFDPPEETTVQAA